MKITLQLGEGLPPLELTDEGLEGFEDVTLKVGDYEAVVGIGELHTAVETLLTLLAARERSYRRNSP